MSDVFADIANSVEPTPSESSQDANTQSSNPEAQASQVSAVDGSPKGDVAMAIAELDKMDKFKLDGQEWTLKDLKAAIMRQKDYTQKTQTLSEERKSFQEERKFHENLAWDLQTIRGSKPEDKARMVQEFIKVYPQKFHTHAEKFLANNQEPQQVASQQQVHQPQVDVQLLSRLQTLEKFYNDQEVSRQETQIKATVDELSKKYPDAANFKEMVMGRAYEARMAGSELTSDDWEKIFKEVNEEVSSLVKAKYGNLVKQQTDANAKGKDVGAGGGTAGRSPAIPKFTSFDQIDKFAQQTLKGS